MNKKSTSKKRRIGYTQYTERSKIPTNKNRDGFVEYESLGEATIINLFSHENFQIYSIETN